MRRFAVIAGALGALLAGAGPAHAGSAPYVVVLRDADRPVADRIAELEGRLGFTAKLRYADALQGFSASLSGSQRDKLVADPLVESVQADATFTAAGASVPVAAGETVPPGVRRVGGVAAALAHGAASAPVAVLDTGVDLANADLDVVAGTNCITPGALPKDDNGHGTHVAGVLAARNTGAGVVGVAPGTRVIAVKVLNAKKTGTLSQLLCGINWVAANASSLGIRVANMSVTGSGSNDNNCGRTNNDAQHKAICAATAAGVTFVVAAGNNGKSLAGFIPAAYPEVLTATAMTDTDGAPGALGAAPKCKSGEKDDVAGTYSNYAVAAADAAHVLAAPGTCVVSDKPGGGTATYFGTSQAAPHIAGAAALCFDGPCAGLAPADVIARLRADAAVGSFTAPTGRTFGPLLRADLY